MTEQERNDLLSAYIDLLNSCKTAEELKQSAEVKDFETKHHGDAELVKLMKASRDLKIMFLDGEDE